MADELKKLGKSATYRCTADQYSHSKLFKDRSTDQNYASIIAWKMHFCAPIQKNDQALRTKLRHAKRFAKINKAVLLLISRKTGLEWYI